MGDKIGQVVSLKKIMGVFQRLATCKLLTNAYSRRQWKLRCLTSYSDECKRINGILPNDVPKGHFAVYTGRERSRFIVPTSYLNHPVFQKLLEKAEEEYGFHHHMGLTVPCDSVAFEYLTSILRNTGCTVENIELEQITEFI